VIAGQRVLAVIPARGGSKGLPRKNVVPLGGRPLIAWTVRAALEAEYVDRVILSSDDDEIAQVAMEAGCEVPFRRPKYLASDTATTADVVLHALQQLPGYEWLVLLQPTSPLRTAQDIDAACLLCQVSNAPSCASVTQSSQSPYWMYRIDQGMQLQPLLGEDAQYCRRQDLPPVFLLNGAVYVMRTDEFLRTRRFVGPGTVAYVMPECRAIDIDTASDLDSAQRLIKECFN
jgi:CMP-N,N'-diacetyllegionaminic acid synthase